MQDIPERLLVVGGGIIGMEMAGVYQALGSRVTVVELTDQLMPGADPDLVKPLQKRMEPKFEAICLGTKVTGIEPRRRWPARQLRGRKRARKHGFRPRAGERWAARPTG